MRPLPHLNERVSAAPGLSPGVVGDKEILLREMYEPHHVKDGAVQEQAIPALELLYDGFSVHRFRFVAREFIEQSIDTKLSRKKDRWKFDGLANLNAGLVRRIAFDNTPAFVVIDTACADNRYHASILAAAHPNRNRSRARKLRSLLLPYLENRVPLKSFQFIS